MIGRRDVSVVVPVYDPGTAIDELLASLDAQTHPHKRWEAILVDDGSTDGTAERLDAWAADRRWAHVEHIPNSGWPGRPRNVGTDRAKGEYVLYVDNDDVLDPRAVELLHARAKATEADVVVGKVVGHGKTVPRSLFRKNLDAVDLSWPPLVRLLSPHKLFRRKLLTEHGIRFPEGRVRLEDHSFVLSAYFHAERIAVLADHPVYHWMRRESGNQSFARMDAAEYFGRDVPRVLDTIDAHVPAGAERDRLYVHWWRTKALWRLQGSACHRRSLEHNLEILAAVRRLMDERFPQRLDAQLPFSLRVLAQLVREDRADAIWALAAYEAGLAARLRLNQVVQRDDGVEVLRFGGRFGGSRLRLRQEGERLLWAPPEELSPHLAGIDLDLTDEPESPPEVIVRAADGVEHLLPARRDLRLQAVEDAELLQPVVRAFGRLNRAKAASGSPLEPGTWTVGVTIRYAGFAATAFHARVLGEDGVLGERRPVTIEA